MSTVVYEQPSTGHYIVFTEVDKWGIPYGFVVQADGQERPLDLLENLLRVGEWVPCERRPYSVGPVQDQEA